MIKKVILGFLDVLRSLILLLYLLLSVLIPATIMMLEIYLIGYIFPGLFSEEYGLLLMVIILIVILITGVVLNPFFKWVQKIGDKLFEVLKWR
jgi:hypothetical protein